MRRELNQREEKIIAFAFCSGKMVTPMTHDIRITIRRIRASFTDSNKSYIFFPIITNPHTTVKPSSDGKE
jgi:hypothetical protein